MYVRLRGDSTTKTSPSGVKGGEGEGGGGSIFFIFLKKISLNECYYVREASGRFDK